MAVIITPADSTGAFRKAFDVEAGLDSDTTATITHGIDFSTDDPNLKMEVVIEALHQKFYDSRWVVTSRSATQVVLTKISPAGGALGASQMRVHIHRVHSVVD